MVTLTLHKDRVITVTGRTEDEMLNNLRRWMILRPTHISGLTRQSIVALEWDRRYDKWRINWLDIKVHGYFEFDRAVKAFVDACSHNICEVTENGNSPGHG